MKVAYVDCFSGISGDMFLGALIDAGMKESELFKALAKVGIEAAEVDIRRVTKKGISAVKLDVRPMPNRPHLHVADIRRILGENDLPEPVKTKALEAFERIVRAESRVHGMAMEKVHLHEVSGLDTIVDLLGVSFAVHFLGLEHIFASPLTVGTGMVRISHGEFPVPAPATAEILKGIPIISRGLAGEHVTPTGAALAATFCERFGELPEMRIEKIGYGAGTRQTGEVPNVLRIMTGEKVESEGNLQVLTMLESNIDDQSPEQIAYVQDKLMAQHGVLDVSIDQILMKKGRPGIRINVLCRPEKEETVTEILFAETTTLGVRRHRVLRKNAPRETLQVKTEFGVVRVVVSGNTVSPEFADCSAVALKSGVALKTVMAQAQHIAEKMRK